MSKKYNHIMSPLKIGNVILKSRLLSANALPHFLQGPENFPADPIMTYLANIAKNGAAVVTFANWTNKTQRQGGGDGVHFPMIDIDDPSVENYMTQLTDAIHFYGSKASIALTPRAPQGYGVCDGPGGMPPGFGPPPGEDDDEDMGPMGEMPPMMMDMFGPVKALTKELMDESIADTVKLAKYYKYLGFDMVSLYMPYRGNVLAQFLSPLSNKRNDEFGGSMENRARYPLMLCEAIKKALGQDFLVEVLMSGEEEEGGITIEDTVEFAKLAEGKVDILQIRGGDGDIAHPTGFNSVKGLPSTLRVAKAIKESGAKIVTAPIGGYQELDDIEQYIASGITDMVGVGRAFICDSDYGAKIIEGRGEDVVPCIRCNRCHGLSMKGPWLSVCSVNPVVGLAHKIDKMIAPPTKSKKVAVIGGGPAGMNAAKVAAERGHKVTLFEKADVLGGQLIHTEYSSFKWPLKEYKDFLIHQIGKLGVEIKLATPATPDMIKSGNFDAVLVAAGAEPNIPDIKGLRAKDGTLVPNACTAISVYGSEPAIGKNVVVVGGSEIGVETAMYLAENGHKVTVLSRQRQLAAEADRVHYYTMFEDAWKKLGNLSYVLKATTTAFENGKVTYVDKKGGEHTLEADTVVISGGMNPRQDEAMGFSGCADEVYIIGDCFEIGNVQKCVRNSYAIASQL